MTAEPPASLEARVEGLERMFDLLNEAFIEAAWKIEVRLPALLDVLIENGVLTDEQLAHRVRAHAEVADLNVSVGDVAGFEAFRELRRFILARRSPAGPGPEKAGP